MNIIYIFILYTGIKQKYYTLFFLEWVEKQRTAHTQKKKATKTP